MGEPHLLQVNGSTSYTWAIRKRQGGKMKADRIVSGVISILGVLLVLGGCVTTTVLENYQGGRYEGETRYGLPNGHGIFYGPDGIRYEGEFKNGKFHGQGTLYFADGTRFEGEFKNNFPNGQGTAYWADGERNYEGEWKNGKRNGQGTMYWASGDRYEGEFKDEKYNGQGTFYRANGDRYEGEFKDSIPVGGWLYRPNGTKEWVTDWWF